MDEENKTTLPWFIKGSENPIPEHVCDQHTEPSPKTIEKISGLEINFARMDEKLDNLLSITKEIKDGKADKWVEKAMTWLIVSTIGLDFIVLGSVIMWWIKKQ